MDSIRLDEHMENVDANRMAKWASSSHSRQALADLYHRFYPKIKAFIASRVSSSEDAEDLEQNVFVELHKKNGWYEGLEYTETYILGIARNLVRRYYRKRAKSVKTIPIEEIDPIAAGRDRRQDSDCANLIQKQELREAIEEILAKLHPKARQAIKLRFIDGLSSKEAAGKAGCSVNTFYQRVHLGRVHLGIEALGKLGPGDSDAESGDAKR